MHRVPNGALRHSAYSAIRHSRGQVRKHRAPNGALGLMVDEAIRDLDVARQKAPSAKQCIKTPTGQAAV